MNTITAIIICYFLGYALGRFQHHFTEETKGE